MRLEDRFVAALRAYPDRPAIVMSDRSWTFAEVDALARSWAARLSTRDGRRPRAVAVLAGRDATSYVGALAALYAGAVLVPLNPTFPAARNAAMMAATNVDALIAD